MALNNQVVSNLYQEDNYFIKINSPKNKCIIFCSSNGLFESCSSNDLSFLKKRYEWMNISKSRKVAKTFGKIIFLRDCHQIFYIEGINQRLCKIDDIISFLKSETKGYEVTIVGYSSGGYLSMLLGYYLKNAVRVYSFAGVFSLHLWRGAYNNYNFSEREAFKKHIEDYEYSKFYSLRNFLAKYPKKCLVYHFYSFFSEADTNQLKTIGNNSRIHLIGFSSKKHQLPINGFDYPKLLTCSKKHLERISRIKSPIGKNRFSIINQGFFFFLLLAFKSVVKKTLSFFVIENVLKNKTRKEVIFEVLSLR